jgi:hypothetical protein
MAIIQPKEDKPAVDGPPVLLRDTATKLIFNPDFSSPGRKPVVVIPPDPPGDPFDSGLAITTPADSAELSGTVPWIATVTGDDAASVQVIRFYIDGALTFEEFNAPYDPDLNTLLLTNASHTLMVRAFNSQGDFDEVSISVTVDNGVDASGFISSPSNGQQIVGSFQFSISAQAPSGVQSVLFKIDDGGGFDDLNTDTSSPYQSSVIDSTQFSNGTVLTLGGTVTPNTGTPADVATIQVTVNNAAPPPPLENVAGDVNTLTSAEPTKADANNLIGCVYFTGSPTWQTTAKPWIFGESFNSTVPFTDAQFPGGKCWRVTNPAGADGASAGSQIFMGTTSPGTGTGSGAGNRNPNWGVGAYDELYLRYLVYFEPGYPFVNSGSNPPGGVELAGKMPGLAGGSIPSGCITINSAEGWSGRMQWDTSRPGNIAGKARVTTYLYASTTPGYTTTPCGRFRAWDAGADLTPGQLHCLEMRYVMNTSGQANGIFEGWFDGVKRASHTGIVYRSGNLKIDCVYLSVTVGGSRGLSTTGHVRYGAFIVSRAPIGLPAGF